jgi:hypothetical protein
MNCRKEQRNKEHKPTMNKTEVVNMQDARTPTKFHQSRMLRIMAKRKKRRRLAMDVRGNKSKSSVYLKI